MPFVDRIVKIQAVWLLPTLVEPCRIVNEGPMGIVAGVYEQISLIEQIDARGLIEAGRSAWGKRCKRRYSMGWVK